MQNIYQTLEFSKIIEKIYPFIKTELGRKYLDNLHMLKSKFEVKIALEELEEMTSIITRFGTLPIIQSTNIERLINIAKKSYMLTPKDLMDIANDCKTISNLNIYFKNVTDNYIHIVKYRSQFLDLSNLERSINNAITPSLTVSSNASEELGNIRNELSKAETNLLKTVNSLANKYKDYLSDTNVTIRDGHHVLPIKTAYKNKILGVIYDVSDTGLTTFIEPLEIVNANNVITSLKLKENEEVRKILKQLTNLVLLVEKEVLSNNKIIGILDFSSAKALYGIKYNLCISKLLETRIIDLRQCYHPLIDENIAVKNDYYLDNKKRIVVISGPNAGGKTVSLKSIGIAVLLNQCGLPVNATNANLSYFKNIFLDIGDNQSLEESLSTFSGHISNIANICMKISGNDLFLLDELGTGTSPKEGEAIALALLKYLEKKNCLGMISSHFSKLKEYAFINPNITNASMIFDEENLSPTYMFKLGVPSESYAIDVAKKYQLHQDILNEANSILKNDNNVDASILISRLEKKSKEISLLEKKVKNDKELLEEEKREVSRLKNDYQQKKKKLFEEFEKEKEALLKETYEKIDELMKNISCESNYATLAAAKGVINSLKDKEEIETFSETISINDNVFVPSLNLYGKVIEKSKSKIKVIGNDGLTYFIKENFATKVNQIPKSNISRIDSQFKNIDDCVKSSVSPELNIIGCTTKEGLDKLINYLQEARCHHLVSVRIIHGFGSGALRNMVKKYLSTLKNISYRPGDCYEGGLGATVITFL